MSVTLTGNPFVDTGLGVIAFLGNDYVDKLSVKTLGDVLGDGSQLARWNAQLKSFTMVFTVNSLLTHPGLKRRGVNVKAYQAVVTKLYESIGHENVRQRCECCGHYSSLDIDSVCRQALTPLGLGDQIRSIGRDWFPLTGSLGSDAQALPAASRSVHICAKCLFAVQYMPLGLMLYRGSLAAFQSTSTNFWYDYLRSIVETNYSIVKAGGTEPLGSKQGSRALLTQLIALMYKQKQWNEKTNMYMWLFTNSGTSPRCEIQEIPNRALSFLWEAVRDHSLRSEIEGTVSSEGKNLRYSLLSCILDGRDYLPLYPKGRWKGASPTLFMLYQNRILGSPYFALQVAYKLARQTQSVVNPKKIKELQKEEAFRHQANRSIIIRLVVEMTESGRLRLDDYSQLFPYVGGPGVKVDMNGWKYIRYYLHHVAEDDIQLESIGAIPDPSRVPLERIIRLSNLIYISHLERRGQERFKNDVLERMKNNSLGINWLRLQFLLLAERYPGFTYADWRSLCIDEKDELFTKELLYQMRLIWSGLIFEGVTQKVAALDVDPAPIDGEDLPEQIHNLVRAVFEDYIAKRGIDGFYQVLERLRRKELDLAWIRSKFDRLNLPFSDEIWRDFLVDSKGRSRRAEAFFQIQLAFVNRYRDKKFISS